MRIMLLILMYAINEYLKPLKAKNLTYDGFLII